MARYQAKFTAEEWRERNRLKRAAYRANNVEKVRRYNAMQRHKGIEPGGHGPCAVCGDEAKLVVDHDHDCCPDKDKSCGACSVDICARPVTVYSDTLATA
jgi:hypothetical protein